MDHLPDSKDEPTSPEMNGHQTSLEADSPPPPPAQQTPTQQVPSQQHHPSVSMFSDYKDSPLQAMMGSHNMSHAPSLPSHEHGALGSHLQHAAMTSHMSAHGDSHHVGHGLGSHPSLHAYGAALSNYQTLWFVTAYITWTSPSPLSPAVRQLGQRHVMTSSPTDALSPEAIATDLL